MNRWSEVKIFLSVIIAPLVLAQLIDSLIRWCYVNPRCSNIHPANLIRLAYSRYKHVRANILALWIFISWIGKADRKGNWSCPIGQDSCTPTAKTKADWLHKSQNLISTANSENRLQIETLYVFTFYFLIASWRSKKFPTLHLFVKTMPIYKPVAIRNGNNEFYREMTRSNLK